MEDRESGEPCCGFCDVVLGSSPVLSPASFSGSWCVQLRALQSGHVSLGKRASTSSHSLSAVSSNKSSGYLVHMGGNHRVPVLPSMSIVSHGLCLKYIFQACIQMLPKHLLFLDTQKKSHSLFYSSCHKSSSCIDYILLLSFKAATVAQMFFSCGFSGLDLLPPSCINNKELCDPIGSPM